MFQYRIYQQEGYLARDLLSLLCWQVHCSQHMMQPQLCARMPPTFNTAIALTALPESPALLGYTLPSSWWGRPNHSPPLSMGKHSSCPHQLRKEKKGLNFFSPTILMTNIALLSISQCYLSRHQCTGWRMLITDLQTVELWSSQSH